MDFKNLRSTFGVGQQSNTAPTPPAHISNTAGKTLNNNGTASKQPQWSIRTPNQQSNNLRAAAATPEPQQFLQPPANNKAAAVHQSRFSIPVPFVSLLTGSGGGGSLSRQAKQQPQLSLASSQNAPQSSTNLQFNQSPLLRVQSLTKVPQSAPQPKPEVQIISQETASISNPYTGMIKIAQHNSAIKQISTVTKEPTFVSQPITLINKQTQPRMSVQHDSTPIQSLLLVQAQQQLTQTQNMLEVALARVKDLERQVHLQKQENEDLRVSLKINKESLQSMIEQKVPEESALIRTINVISSENIKLQMQLERMRLENEQLKTTILTGRSHAIEIQTQLKPQAPSKQNQCNIQTSEPKANLEITTTSSTVSKVELLNKSTNTSLASSSQNEVGSPSPSNSSKKQSGIVQACEKCSKLQKPSQQLEEEKKFQKKILPKGHSKGEQNASQNQNWDREREEAFRENERTVKKLMVEVARLQTFMKDLLENYSLPENLQEDIKEMLYQQEMTHYDNNNEFFANLPLLSPISNSFVTGTNNSMMSESTLPNNLLRKVIGSNHQQQQQKAPTRNFGIPKLDFTKLKPEVFDENNNFDQQQQYIMNNYASREGMNQDDNPSLHMNDSNLLDDLDFKSNVLLNNFDLLSSMRQTNKHQQELEEQNEDPANTQNKQASLANDLGMLSHEQDDHQPRSRVVDTFNQMTDDDNNNYIDEGGNFIYGTSDNNGGFSIEQYGMNEERNHYDDEGFKNIDDDNYYIGDRQMSSNRYQIYKTPADSAYKDAQGGEEEFYDSHDDQI